MDTGPTTDVAVARQARTAREVAPELCAPTGCAWYHGTWPTLRALGLVASPDRHAALFERALHGVARRVGAAGADVLVSGAADGAMVELVIAAFAPHGVPLRITVLDRCATPVHVATEVAARAGIPVEPWVVDVVDADAPGSFDAVCTHGLLPLQEPEVRPQVVRRWGELLRPGGVAVTTSSIAAAAAVGPVRFTADAVEAFAASARDALAGAGPLAASLPFAGPDELHDAARTWAARAVASPVSLEELERAFAAAGFDLDLRVREIAGALRAAASGPWTARRTRYAEAVATKR